MSAIQTTGELVLFEGWKYMNARPWGVKTPWVGERLIVPAFDGGQPWVDQRPDGWLMFRAGYCYDGPSGPTHDDQTNLRGAQMHDGRYQLARHGLGDLSDAMRDRVDVFLYDMCRADGMSWLRAQAWLRGVRTGSGFAWKRQLEHLILAPSGKRIEIPNGQTPEQALRAAGL